MTDNIIYEETCKIEYQNKYFPLRAGSNITSGHVCFYDDYIIVSFMGSTKIPYDEIHLVIKEKFMLVFGQYFVLARNGSNIKIIIRPKDFEKMKNIFLSKIGNI